MFDITKELLDKRPLSYSSLKAFRKSPRHYIDYLERRPSPSPSMILGSLVDCLLLTPELFEKKFLLTPKINRRSNAGKAEYQQYLDMAINNNLTMIDEDQLSLGKHIKESVLSDETAGKLLAAKTNCQKHLTWRHVIDGYSLPMRGYLDFESNAWGESFLVDLKTSKSADPRDFEKDIANYEYFLQMACYLDAYKRKWFKFPYFIFLVVETTEPFGVSINFCDAKMVEYGKKELIGTMRAFKYCMENNLWDRSYDFRLFETKDYFNTDVPKWKKSLYSNF